MDKQTQNAPETEQRLGCGQKLGCLIVLLAVLAAVFYFGVRPKLEENGVDVDAKLGEYREKAGELAETAARKAAEGVDAVRSGGSRAARKVGELTDGAGEKLDTVKTQSAAAGQAADDTIQAGLDAAGH